ncbi:MAG TPA: DUF5926 family protein [Pseudonocardia sp.]|jgi:hypothetical protein
MSKKTRTRPRPAASTDGPNPKQPCPCGSGKRYKACHGGGDEVIVLRPFEGLAAECDLVAMREFVPSGTAGLTLSEAGKALAGDRTARLATVLPGAAAALVRPNGEALVGLQVQTRTGDIATDLGRALRWALTAEPSTSLAVAGPALDTPESGPVRLHDLVVPDAELDVTLYTDFTWWLPEDAGEPSGDAAAALEHANNAIMPTELVRGDGVRGAYWVDAGAKSHLRWVRPEPEDQLVAALARLQVRGELELGEGSRYVGSFRAHGLLVPVWDLDKEMHVKEWVAPAEAFAARLTSTLRSLADQPLTDAEHRARGSLAGRQITLR